jgi:rhamnogalacturonyl hydrolase YesR
MAESVMSRFQGLGLDENVTGPYEDGFLHLALQKILYFGNLRPAEVNHYYGYLSHGVENELTPLGDIRGFSLSDQYLDNAILGHGYLAMYETTREPKYAKAAQALRENLDTQPLNYQGKNPRYKSANHGLKHRGANR